MSTILIVFVCGISVIAFPPHTRGWDIAGGAEIGLGMSLLADYIIDRLKAAQRKL